MPSATPPVVDRDLIDIDFSGGLNEAVQAESVDWTKYLKVADNIDFGTKGVMKVRKGLYAVADSTDTNSGGSYPVSPLFRLMASSRGLLAAGYAPLGAATGGGYNTIVAYNGQVPTTRSLSTAAWTAKGPAGQFSVTPQSLGATSTDAKVIGTCYTTRWNIVVTTPNSVDYFIYVLDPTTGLVARVYQVANGTSSAAMALVSGRYLHLYIGPSGSCKVFQLDTESLPETFSSGTSLTSATLPVAAVAIGAASYVVFLNGNLSKVNTSETETLTGSVAGFASNQIHDMATDGTSLFIVGRNSTPRGLLKVVSTAFSTTRTVTDTDATLAAAKFSVGCDSSSNCKLMAQYSSNPAGSFLIPTCRLLTCTSAATVFTSNITLPGWAMVASPIYSSLSGRWYGAVVDLPDAGVGVGHNTLSVAGNCLLIDFDAVFSNATQFQIAAAAVLDRYTEYSGPYAVGTGIYQGSAGGSAQHMFSADNCATLTIATPQRISANGFSTEFRTLKMADATHMGCAVDMLSGGVTSSYDGTTMSEAGFFGTPNVYVADAGSGTGVNAGTRNYLVIWEHIDSAGRRHLSKCSNPFAITLASAHDVNIYLTFPSISGHRSNMFNSGTSNVYNFAYHIYRTVAGGTQYYRVKTGLVTAIGATTSSITTNDAISDTTLQTQELLHRHPGTVGTALDRYCGPSSSCITKHKDRFFVGRGSTVFYSSFDVDNEASWFNPALSFAVPGLGPITAVTSFEGLLVIFRKNGIWIVDGDGPPENGGSGVEFSPPRRLSTNYGCIDQRTLVHTPIGIMFMSQRGIELLSRNLTVSWIGERVKTTTTNYPYVGGAAFDPSSGRAVWIVAQYAGTYPGTTASNNDGYALVYNTNTDAWSRSKLLSNAGYGYAFQDVAFAEVGSKVLNITAVPRLCFIDQSYLWFENGYVDHKTTDVFIPTEINSAWIKAQSKQERIRLDNFTITGLKNAAAKYDVSYAANYATSYTSVASFSGATVGAMTVVELETQPPTEAVQSMSFKVTTSDPTPTSFGTGQQCDIYGLTVRLGIRGGGRKLPVGQKG